MLIAPCDIAYRVSVVAKLHVHVYACMYTHVQKIGVYLLQTVVWLTPVGLVTVG